MIIIMEQTLSFHMEEEILQLIVQMKVTDRIDLEQATAAVSNN